MLPYRPYTHVMEAKKQADMQLLDDGAKIS